MKFSNENMGKELMSHEMYKQMIDELIILGYNLAKKILKEQITDDSSESLVTTKKSEELAIISRFVEILMEIDKRYPSISVVSKGRSK